MNEYMYTYVYACVFVGLRALQLSQCQGVSMAKQDDYSGSGLCIEWHLQLYHTVTCALSFENVIKSDYIVVGASTGCGLSRCALLLSAGECQFSQPL